jgi:hypothetical protein
LQNDQSTEKGIKKNEMDGACDAHGREEKCVQSSGGKAGRKNDLEDQGIDGNVGPKWTLGR